jgi:carbamoyltransferase
MGAYVLGVSGLYHDAAAALVHDGEVIAAVEEERFSRRKHDPRFPRAAIRHCLERLPAGERLAAAVFYENVGATLGRVTANAVDRAPDAMGLWRDAAGSMIAGKLNVHDMMREAVGPNVEILECDHHAAHAASCYYPSPFDAAAVLVVDGVGEWATTTLAVGEGTDIRPLQEVRYPHSLGLLYSAFTYFCGFKVNSGEYKLMGLAPYGVPRYADVIRDALIEVKDDGSFRLNLECFGFLDSDVIVNERFDRLFGGPPRRPETALTRREMDLAASVQAVTEDVMLRLVRRCVALSGARRLCMAGGVALNCVANGRIVAEKAADEVWIQPAAGDAGGALGAALLTSHRRFAAPRPPLNGRADRQKASRLGPSYDSSSVRRALDMHGLHYERLCDPTARRRRIAQALAEGAVVGYFQGPLEFGPRALGGRSILADPRSPTAQAHINLQIKFRESWRPFAPIILRERVADYFEFDDDSPYMLLTAPVRRERRLDFDLRALLDAETDLMPIINRSRSDIPAVTHVDYSARLQTVSRQDSPDLHALLSMFDEITGCPVLVNTSFNVRGEPIVCSPHDAITCFLDSGIDLLALEDCLVWKSAQNPDLVTMATEGRRHELD